MSAPTVDHAIHETRQLARELGVACEPGAIADRSNLVLALAPHPLVARVAMATSMVRVGMEWLRREVDVSRFLVSAGGAVTRPAESIAPGPFERAGLVISFWQREDVLADPISGALAGARLAAIHGLLRRYEGTLPEWGGWIEARAVLARASATLAPAERDRLHRAWERGERIVDGARGRTASFQPVHGDAHLGNVLATRDRGPVWTDWEDAFVGPVEYDLACLTSRRDLFDEERALIDAARDAYDLDVNGELLRDLALVRNLQVIPWLAVFAERDPSLLARMRARIDKLPAT